MKDLLDVIDKVDDLAKFLDVAQAAATADDEATVMSEGSMSLFLSHCWEMACIIYHDLSRINEQKRATA